MAGNHPWGAVREVSSLALSYGIVTVAWIENAMS